MMKWAWSRTHKRTLLWFLHDPRGRICPDNCGIQREDLGQYGIWDDVKKDWVKKIEAGYTAHRYRLIEVCA